MRDRSLLIKIPLMILVSGGIAYGLVFWTPWFGAREDYGFGHPRTGWYTVGYYDTWTPEYDAVDLANLQPEEFQSTVQAIFDEAVKLTDAQLYMLNSIDDICRSTLIDCQGVPSKNVKPFVEKALAHKQASQTVAISMGSLDTARLSLAVAFCAFIVSVAGLFLKRKS